jgi:hypothetical protein
MAEKNSLILAGKYIAGHNPVRERRFFSEFQYRFNRRFDLHSLMPRLAYVAARTPPLPDRLLTLAGKSGNQITICFVIIHNKLQGGTSPLVLTGGKRSYVQIEKTVRHIKQEKYQIIFPFSDQWQVASQASCHPPCHAE